jgi:hypothetical protein
VLKEIGLELSSYHGRSLNGMDIKKVMNNATYIFDQFAAIFKEVKREGCQLMDADIDLMCLHFGEVYVLWDKAFSLGRTINPTDEDCWRRVWFHQLVLIPMLVQIRRKAESV